MHPSLFSRLSPLCGQVAAASGHCQGQSRSGNLVKTARWRAAGCTNLITMMDLSSVGLYKLNCEAAEQLEAADGCCSSFWRTAVAQLVCTSDRPELWHVLETRDKASVRSSLRVRSDVCVC